MRNELGLSTIGSEQGNAEEMMVSAISSCVGDLSGCIGKTQRDRNPILLDAKDAPCHSFQK